MEFKKRVKNLKKQVLFKQVSNHNYRNFPCFAHHNRQLIFVASIPFSFKYQENFHKMQFVVKVFDTLYRYDEELIAVTFKYRDNNRDKSTN